MVEEDLMLMFLFPIQPLLNFPVEIFGSDVAPYNGVVVIGYKELQPMCPFKIEGHIGEQYPLQFATLIGGEPKACAVSHIVKVGIYLPCKLAEFFVGKILFVELCNGVGLHKSAYCFVSKGIVHRV